MNRSSSRTDGDLGLWAEPDWDHLKFLMRQVYEQRDSSRERGLAGSRTSARILWQRAASVAEARIRCALADRPADGTAAYEVARA